MATRERVYEAIDTERDYQNELNGKVLAVGEEIALALKYTHDALDEWSNDFSQPEVDALEMMRKVAGICVRCMENHGAHDRVAVEDDLILPNIDWPIAQYPNKMARRESKLSMTEIGHNLWEIIKGYFKK